MVKSYNELMDMLHDGEDINKIIEGRLSYLKSQEYKETLSPRIYSQNDESVLLFNGFITEDEVMRIRKFK